MSMGQCCATGSLHTGKPAGSISTVHGLKTYTAPVPDSPKGTIVILPDAFGIALPNNKILADDYAKAGFRVYLPDFFNGYVIPADLLISFHALGATGFYNQVRKIGHVIYMLRYLPLFLYHARYSSSHPQIINFLSGVRKEYPGQAIGVAGFCWGGLHVMDLVSNKYKTPDGKRVVDVGFTAHPSMLTYPDNIETVELPVSVAASEIDPQMSPEQAKQTEEILVGKTKKGKDIGIEHEFVFYPGAHHGFAVRADENDKVEAANGKKAEKQAVDWFTRWFADPPKASL